METSEKYVVGVDVGGTNIRIGRLTPGLEVENLVKVQLSDVLSGERQPYKLADFISEYCRGLPIKAVAVGLPGILDRKCERVLNTPNIPGLNGANLKSILESYLEFPVFLENDAVMLLSGDIRRLELKPEGIYLGCYIGTGLGSAIFIGGNVPKGRNGINEIGHMPIYGKSEQCSCGNVGCAENYVSGRYLQKIREQKYSDSDISEIFTAIKGSDEYCDYIEILSVVLASAVNLIDPDAVIIGGGVPLMTDFPKFELYNRVYFHAMKPVPAKSLNILYSPNCVDAGVFGAALYAKNKINAIKSNKEGM